MNVSSKVSTITNTALKEWPTAIQALCEGTTILLFRKGGIHEMKSRFKLPTERAVLFPSFEHQKLEMLKNPPQDEVTLTAYKSDDEIPISCWVKFVKSWEIQSQEQIQKLDPFHIWTHEFILNRFAWKPERPLYLLGCQAFSFPKPPMLKYSNQYGGCKSWITLMESLSLAKSHPVLAEDKFIEQLQIIDDCLLESS